MVLPDHRRHQQKNLTSKETVLWSFWCCKPEHRGDSSSFDRSNDTWTWKGSWCCCSNEKKSSNPLPPDKTFIFTAFSLLSGKQTLELFYSKTILLCTQMPFGKISCPRASPCELGMQQTKVVLSPESFPSRPIEPIVPPQEIPCSSSGQSCYLGPEVTV